VQPIPPERAELFAEEEMLGRMLLTVGAKLPSLDVLGGD